VTVSAEVSYPLEVEGQLDPGLSRGLWLVKWFLAIPHVVVLAFLWVAFFVLTFVALVAIVFTGRYPRSLFEFNVGVLRWTWRVGFYAFAALGTDRYPPFSLGPVPEYPARLDVVYPARLSRGLALVKWWLLAIPQYVIVAFLLGGGTRWSWAASSIGLIDVLVFFGAVALLFTGRYPQGIFDLAVGLDRWAFRVVAYAGLMTDRYPPFRLDMGGTEPAAPLAVPEADADAAPVARARRWTFGRVVLVVLGSLAALLAFGLASGGAAALVLDHTQRDGDGYLMSPSKHLSTGSYALVSQPTDLDSELTGRDFLGTVRIRTDSDRRVFVGIARSAAAAAYLNGMRRAEITEIGPWHVGYDVQSGGPPATAPASQTFWSASAAGSGEQVLDWKPSGGTWRVVVMNADGSPRVAVDASIGAQLDNWVWVGVGLLVAALLFAFAAAALIHLGVTRAASGEHAGSPSSPTLGDA
jgi:hypothetical protein